MRATFLALFISLEDRNIIFDCLILGKVYELKSDA